MCFAIKLKNRLIYGIAIAIVGIASFATGLYCRGSLLNEFLAGFYTGTGGGLFTVGIVLAIRCICVMRNEEKRKKVEIDENDERTRFITDRTGFITCMTMMAILYVASLVSGFLNLVVFFALVGATVLMILIMLVTNAILKKKY